MALSLIRRGVPFARGGGDALDELLLSLNPSWYTKYDEVVGNLINYGSDGNSGTVAGATQGAAAIQGLGSYSFDGIDDIVTFTNANVPNTKALTTQRWFFLVNAVSLGELSSGAFFRWGTSPALFFRNNNRMQAAFVTDTTDANVLTDNNEVDFLGTDTLVFMDYDDGDTLGLGRNIRIMRATAASATTLLTLGTDTAATGTLTVSADDLSVGNRDSLTTTMDGRLALGLAAADAWSPAGTPADLSLPDQIRSLVFGV